ncbi:MAG: hypothetical protein H6733_04760 [Alphaproteobacteria bacterium]|nr:hypothetical protein [Alphaproteobacteria bacterium]
MRHAVLPLLALAAACTPPGTDDAPEADTTVMLAAEVGFLGADEEGLSDGFDLDGVATERGSPNGCGMPDYANAAGVTGIDNSFAGLIPIIELAGGQALAGLVQEAVDMGELLIMFQVDDWEAAAPGDCVHATMLRGLGDPVIGGDDRILPFQTFDPNPAFPVADVTCAAVQDDRSVVLDGFEYRLPLRVLDETIDLTLHGGKASLTPTEDGWRVLIAGGISIQELKDNILGFDALPASLISTVLGALDLRADLAPDGSCTQMSTVIAAEAVPAFFFDEALPADDAASDVSTDLSDGAAR